MKMEINLWLERYDPRITVRDTESGCVLLTWDSRTLQRELARGDLCMENLCDSRLSCAERLGLVVETRPGRLRRLRC